MTQYFSFFFLLWQWFLLRTAKQRQNKPEKFPLKQRGDKIKIRATRSREKKIYPHFSDNTSPTAQSVINHNMRFRVSLLTIQCNVLFLLSTTAQKCAKPHIFQSSTMSSTAMHNKAQELSNVLMCRTSRLNGTVCVVRNIDRRHSWKAAAVALNWAFCT